MRRSKLPDMTVDQLVERFQALTLGQYEATEMENYTK